MPLAALATMVGFPPSRWGGCLSVEQQLAFHSRYEPHDVDLANVALLRA